MKAFVSPRLEQRRQSLVATKMAPMHANYRDPIIDAHLQPTAETHALLQVRARQLSRQIGEAKRAGRPVEHLIAERRRIKDLLQAADAESAPSMPPHWDATNVVPESKSPASEQPPVQPMGDVRIRAFEASDAAAWDAFVRTRPEASVYHFTGWRTVCQLSFGHPCPYLLAECNGHLVGVLPLVQLKSRLFGHFMVSMPYFNYGGALGVNDEVRQALLNAASALAAREGCSHLELRNTTAQPNWPVRTDKVSMWLDLPPSSDLLWQRIGSKVRAQVKKAQRAQWQFSFGGAELLDDFYRVFAIHMRDLGTPVYSKRFFAHVLQHGPGNPVLVVGRTLEGEPVSVALLLRHGHRMEVPWASTLRRAHEANANMALYWQLLTFACDQGCLQFDFGRSTQDAPTFRFKKQWGALPVPLYWHYWLADGGQLPRLNPDNPKYRMAIGVWKRLPVWLTRWLGPPIVKNLP